MCICERFAAGKVNFQFFSVAQGAVELKEQMICDFGVPGRESADAQKSGRVHPEARAEDFDGRDGGCDGNLRIVAQAPDKNRAFFENDACRVEVAAQIGFPFWNGTSGGGGVPVPACFLELTGIIAGERERAVVKVQNPPLRMKTRDGKEQEEQQRTDHFSFLLMASG